MLAVLLLFQAAPELTHGPFLGPTTARSATVWARAAVAGRYQLALADSSGTAVSTVAGTADAASDFVLHWRLDGLQPGARYAARIHHGEQALGALEFTAAIGPEHPRASVAFGSCADERRFPEQPVWAAIASRRPDALVLLGDTPYIDSTELEVQRRRYREFFAHPPIAACLRQVATYATWDDHDYAGNDRFGAVAGRAAARQAFLEYHPGDFGRDGQGLFTSFRRGPLEVFVLDTRWFADAEESPLAPGQRSLLGGAQLAWLQEGLAASSADFKVLCCGMVWNAAVRPGKQDCWSRWPAERDALLRWIGARAIRGVILVGGDIHRARAILHPTAALAGYDVPEFISSPLAQAVIEAAAVEHPGLWFDAGAPQVFLQLEAERAASGAWLTARFVDGAGVELFERRLAAAELAPPAAK